MYGFEQSDAISGWHGRLLISDVGQNACTANAIHGLSIAQVTFHYYFYTPGLNQFSVVPQLKQLPGFMHSQDIQPTRNGFSMQ